MKKSSIINGYISIWIDIAPSVRPVLNKILDKHEINNAKEFVKQSKKKVFSIQGLTPYMKDKLVEFMDQYELHFGMTDAEIEEYMDADYFENHPEEKTYVEAGCIYNASEEAEDVNAKKIDLSPELQKILNEEPEIVSDDLDNTSEYCRMHERTLSELIIESRQYRDLREVVPPDEWEAVLNYSAMRIFASQPLFVKLVCPTAQRVRQAVMDAEALVKELRENARERNKAIMSLKEKISSRIDEETKILKELRSSRFV